jgi:hypothetical protein
MPSDPDLAYRTQEPRPPRRKRAARVVRRAVNRAAPAVREVISQGTWPKTGTQLLTEVGAYTDSAVAAHNALTTAHGVDLTKVLSSPDGTVNSSVATTASAYTALGSNWTPGRVYFVPGTASGAPGGALASDAFNRTVTDGWLDADIGGTYALTGSAADFDVASGAGTINHPTAGASGNDRVAVPSAMAAALEQNAVMRYSINQLPTVSSHSMFWELRYQAALQTYRVRCEITTAGAVRLTPQYVAGAGAVDFAAAVTVAGLTYTAGMILNFRAQVTGSGPATILRGKVWQDGTTEPSAWATSFTDTASGASAATTPAQAAIYSRMGANAAPVPMLVSVYDYSIA